MYSLIIRILKITILILLVGSSTGIAATSHPEDPFEPYNRAMFRFNETMDDILVKPISQAYSQIIPEPAQKGIANFFRNLQNIPTGINDLLQGEFQQATATAWRLLINSTVGIFGLVDVAGKIGLPHRSNDFGLTLAKWGVKTSPYLVLPFLGPSTLRDAVGRPIDFQVLSAYSYIQPEPEQYGLYLLEGVTRRAELLQYETAFEYAAFDPYVFQRNAYLQRRKNLINAQSLEEADFFDDEDWSDFEDSTPAQSNI